MTKKANRKRRHYKTFRNIWDGNDMLFFNGQLIKDIPVENAQPLNPEPIDTTDYTPMFEKIYGKYKGISLTE